MRILGVSGIFGALFFSIMGCGQHTSSTDGGSVDGAVAGTCLLDGSKLLSTLTTAEFRTLCDCSAALGGGYGQTQTCSNGETVKTPTDQASCVVGQTKVGPTCTATVNDALSCAAEAQQCSISGPGCQLMAHCLSTDAGG